MRPILLNNCLAKSKTLEKVKNFFEDVCHLKLQLLDPEGYPVACGDSQDQISTDHLRPSLITEYSPSSFVEKSLFVSADIVEECTRTQRPVHFLCARGYRNFLVPIIKRNQVAGFLTTGEKEGVLLEERQIKSMVIFLNDVLKKSLEEDLVIYKDFAAQPFSPQRRILSRVLKYITDHYESSSLTLREVAEENGVSYFHLSHLFKKELKTTFSDYLNHLRISVAVRLLKDQSLTVNQVAMMCGYDDPSYFGKVFKKIHSETPVAFRNKECVEIPVIADDIEEMVLQD